ncbi:Glycosyltransferase-like 1B [Podila clonocystis]|nr:Glycosyltransferase-like 1B [Podila clonocystis]
MPLSLLDQPKYRRLHLAWRRNIRVFKRSFNLHPIRNLAIIFTIFFILSSVVSKIGHSTNTPEQRWHHLKTFATEPGTLGAPPEAEPDTNIHVQLCNVDGMCSSWDQDRIWMESELKRDESWLEPGWINVQLGTQAIITTRSGQHLKLGYGIHKCGESSLPVNCRDIISLTVEESILSAIDGIAEVCARDDWATQPAIVHTVRPAKGFSKRDVTMIAQYSKSRLYRFEHSIRVWPGPISIVLFLATNDDIKDVKAYFEQKDKLSLYDNVVLTIIKPNYSLGTHTRYPINHLRNVGIQTATTDYTFVMDADFVPTTKLYSFAKASIIPQLEEANYPTAYVVPCVAIKEEYKEKFPDTIEELQPLMKSGMAYITDPRAGHGPTGTKLFMNPHIYGSSPAFEVCFESQWEPYYIVNKNQPHPYYDERFKNQGGDKQSHALMMNAIGFKFLVLRDHFMYHMDHPKLAWTGAGLDQKNEKDFSYFADYSPMLEKIFGSTYRWPRGCSDPFVSSSKIGIQGIGVM